MRVDPDDEFEDKTVMQYVERNHELLQHLNKQLHVQHEEHMRAMHELTALSRAQLEIAQQYKEWVGDPLKKGSYALSILGSVFAWVIGATLTVWGLKEIFDSYFIPRIKP